MLLAMMDRLEALMGVGEEVELLGKQVFNYTVEQLDQMERDGYFAFAREGWSIMERVVSEFNEEDVRALGDNIVTILTTVRNMTQPEVLALANNAIGAIQDGYVPDKPISTLQLLQELRKPEVRIGIARMLNLVKVLANNPQEEIKSTN
jgi:uncharacterized protein YjgD (DUF1641 family)